jgi:hypothetical protein
MINVLPPVMPTILILAILNKTAAAGWLLQPGGQTLTRIIAIYNHPSRMVVVYFYIDTFLIPSS